MAKRPCCSLSNDELRELLLGTGDAPIIEHTTNDNYWGDGGDGNGKKLGKILMEVRTKLKVDSPSDVSRPDALFKAASGAFFAIRGRLLDNTQTFRSDNSLVTFFAIEKQQPKLSKPWLATNRQRLSGDSLIAV